MRKLTERDADRFYGEPLARYAAHFKMWCRIAADEIRHARDLQAKAETNCRHWREEAGKLHSQLRAGRAKLAEER